MRIDESMYQVDDMQMYKSLKPDFLINSGIKPLQRYMLKNWMIQEMTRTRSLRQTYAVASKILDAYLLNYSSKFPLQSLQNLGIACWIIGTKVCGQRIPPINFESYNQQQVWALQKQICVRLDFNLHPITYVSHVGQITKIWDNFAQINELELFKYNCLTEQSANYYLNILNILDGADLIPAGYRFNSQTLVLNTFFLINYFKYTNTRYGQQNQNMPALRYRSDQFQKIFKNFCHFLKEACLNFQDSEISKQAINFIKPIFNSADHKRIMTSKQLKMLNILKHIQMHDRKICLKIKQLLRPQNQ